MATPLGALLLAANTQALIGAWFEGQKDFPNTQGWHADTEHPVLKQAAHQIEAYFWGTQENFDLPLHFAWGTEFQRAVWTALLGIHHGQSCCYSDIAQQIGRPSAVRAVGAAIGLNPISIVVPCHRVLGRDGSLTGYAGGLDRKRALLALEGIA